MAIKRRSRRNAWFGKPRLHSKAAKRGWRGRRSSRRTRRNAGSMVMNSTRSLRAGFDPAILKRATAILAGNISTTWYVDQIGSRIGMVRSNPFVEVATLLALSGANAMVVSKVLKQPKYAGDVLIGGILAGVTRGIKAIAPGMFSTCGLRGDEGMDGFGDMGAFIRPGLPVVTPNGMYTGQLMSGMGGYASPSAVRIGTSGMGDEVVYPQVQNANVNHFLDGMADMALAEDLAMQS